MRPVYTAAQRMFAPGPYHCSGRNRAQHSLGQARVENCDLAAQSPPYRLESFCLLMVSYRSCITAATWLARLNGRSHKGYDESQCRLQSPIQS